MNLAVRLVDLLAGGKDGFLAIASFVAMALQAQANNSLSLEVHEIGTGAATYTNWEDGWGGYDRDFSRSKRILITVRDLSRKQQGFDVTVYFIARPADQPNGHPFIYDRVETSQKFDGRIEVSGAVASRSLKARVQNYPLIGQRYASGSDMDGWIVVGKTADLEFGVRASNQTLLELAHRPDSQIDSLQAMVAEYNKKYPSRFTNPSPPIAREPVRSNIQTPAASAAARTATPAQIEYATLTIPTEVAIHYGKTTLPRGTRLQLISRSGQSVTVRYLNETVSVPISATDLK